MGDQPTISNVRALNGKVVARLSSAETATLNFYGNQGRKFGVKVSIRNQADPVDLLNAESRQEAHHILKSVNMLITVDIPGYPDYGLH